MMRSKKSFKWLTTMVGIALLVVLLGAFPGYAAKPVADADGPYVGTQADTVTLDGRASYDPDPDGTIVEYEWKVDNLMPPVYKGSDPTYALVLSVYSLGDHEVKLKVTDNEGKKKDDKTKLTVNNAPPVAVADSYSTDEDTKLTVHAKDGVLANDIYEDGDRLTATLVTDVSRGTLTLHANGKFTYTPADNFNGSDSFTYTVKDNGGATSNVATVTINVGVVNDAPVAVADSYSTDEDTKLTVHAKDGVLANDTDEDGDRLTATLVTDVSNGTLTLRAKGTFTYTHDGSETTSDSFTYKANDGNGGSDQATVSITITPQNDAPLAVDDSYSTDEDTKLTVHAKDGVLSNDTDEDGDRLTATLVTDVSNGTLTLRANGTFTYTPGDNFNGTDRFRYKANDGTADSNTVTVTINVTPVNDALVANDDSDTTPEDTPVSTNVVTNDTDVDGTVVASTVAIVSGPRNGSVVNNGNGTVTYTPNANFNGSDSFTYTVKDNGGATSNVAIVTINVGAVNDPPVAQMDSAITDENMPVTIPVLANDSDLDGDRLTVESVTQHSNGTVTNNGTDVTYSPDPDFNGMDTFTYTVADGNGGTDTTTVMVAVAVVNDPPVAQEDSAITDENMPVTIPVLVNDSDPDGDRLTVESVTQPSNGTVTNNGTDVTYSPGPDFNGMDTFTYTVSDKNGSADTARVSVEVLEGAADGEGGAYGPSEGKVIINELADRELVSQVRFVKRDTDNSWLVPGVPDLTVLEDSMVLEKLALSTDLEPTRYRAGAHLEVGVELPTMEERRAHGWPWIRVTSPDLAEPGNVTAGFSFSGRSADGIYWFGIDIGDVPWGRYDFWIVYGEGKMILVPIIVSP